MKLLTKISITSALLLGTVGASAEPHIMISPADYRTYHSSHGDTVTTSVTDSQGANWKQYSSFLGHENQWLWVSGDGEQLYWLADSGKRELLLNANDAVGTEYSVTIDGCTNKARVADKHGELTMQSGTYDNAIRLDFSGYCFDAGLKSAWFVPKIGLIKWSQDSMLGAIDFELGHAKVDGMSIPNQQGIELSGQFPADSLMLDEKDSAEVYLTLLNHSDETVTLDFRSGQTFDIYLHDDDGQLVSKWSHGKMFTQALHSMEIKPGQVERFGDVLPLVDLEGKPLDIGSYQIKIEITGSFASSASSFTSMTLSAESVLHLDNKVTHY